MSTWLPAPAARASGEPLLSAHDACKAALAREEAGDRTTSSRGPCHKAYLLGGATEDMRDEVASLMSPARTPTLDDLAIASLIADAAVRRSGNDPWAYLARCDVARRTKNAVALEACIRDLKRVAPNSTITRDVLATARERTPALVWIFRVLLLALVGFTMGHALRAVSLTRRRGRSAAVALLTGWAILLGLPATVHAFTPPKKDHLSDFPIDDADPESSVPSPEVQNDKPLEFGYFLQDLAAKAEKASKRGDHEAAARFYGAVTKAAPAVAYGPREMCVELEAAGDVATAIKACRTAITRLGSTAGDYTRFISLVLATKGPLIPEERKELEMILDHLKSEPNLGALPTMLRCEVDLRVQDFPALTRCTRELAALAPKDPKTISLQWALALHNHDRGQALELIDRARTAGMNGDGVARMQKATRAMTLRLLGTVCLVLLVVAGIALVAVRLRREAQRRRPAAVDSAA